MLVHDFVLLFIHVWKWFDLLCTGHGEGFAKQKPTTEVQSVFKQLSTSCIPLAVKCGGLLPVASCCVMAGGKG